MTRDYLLSLSDIIENMEKTRRFVGAMSYEEFVAHEMACYAVVRCLEIIGEAVKNVPQEIRARRPEVSWKETWPVFEINASTCTSGSTTGVSGRL